MYNFETFNPHTIRQKPLSEIIKANEKLVWYEEKQDFKLDNHKPVKENDNER